MNGKEGGIDVAEVAKLARLELEPERIPSLQKEMEAIVGYVDMLAELDTDGIEPTVHAVERVNIIREDTPGQPCPRELMLRTAPAIVDGELVRVPQVLPGEGMA